jgi:hypothetical protein
MKSQWTFNHCSFGVASQSFSHESVLSAMTKAFSMMAAFQRDSDCKV